ncbi:MAG TPA: peptidoglycan-binding domain-containing protein [Dermatophilaceae bacterium]|nr:peptidoglycan-binding domain-containing protein [Dermatophilaceae bacterium]
MNRARALSSRVATSVACALMLAAGIPAVAHGAQPPPVGPTTESGTLLGPLSLIPWYAAPSLVTLRKEVDARWPGRSRLSDGVIGDTRHAARTNSHNPVGAGGGPGVGTRGAVHALDITSSGIDVQAFLAAVVGDARVWYVIHNGQIWSRTTGWAAVAHRGDPHTTHIHVNLREDSQAVAVAAENDTRSWFGTGSASPAFLSGSTAALTAAQTRGLQRALISQGYSIPAGATGKYGAQTTAAVAAFQQAQGWSGSQADGIAGPETLRRLGITTSTGSSSGRGASAAIVRAKSPKKSAPSAPAVKPSATGRAWDPEDGRLVYDLQNALIAKGYSIPAGPTGYFGTRTKEAVAAFQASLGFSGAQADGIPGPTTLRRLGL